MEATDCGVCIRLRGCPVSNFPAASISNTDGKPPIGRQLHGAYAVKMFCSPECSNRRHPILIDGWYRGRRCSHLKTAGRSPVVSGGHEVSTVTLRDGVHG